MHDFFLPNFRVILDCTFATKCAYFFFFFLQTKEILLKTEAIQYPWNQTSFEFPPALIMFSNIKEVKRPLCSETHYELLSCNLGHISTKKANVSLIGCTLLTGRFSKCSKPVWINELCYFNLSNWCIQKI